jgi:predicted MPP superfamily phosphohydrolase
VGEPARDRPADEATTGSDPAAAEARREAGPRPARPSSPRLRGHDRPPLRHWLDEVLRHLPRPLWVGEWMAAVGLQGQVGVTTWRESVPGLHRPLRVAFASDFHAGPLTAGAHLRATLRRLATLSPDLLLLGGDFVSGRAAWARELVDGLAALRPPLGTWAVLGNHDLWSDFDELEVMLLASGIELLTNRAVPLPPPYDAITLCGLDDHTSGLPDPAAIARAEGFRLLLVHSPAGLRDLGGAPVDLALAGHTHAGQICLPGGFPLVMPSGEGVRRLAYGRFGPAATGNGTLIVSRGVGFSGLPLRAFAPPEVVLLELLPAG